VCTAVSGLTH